MYLRDSNLTEGLHIGFANEFYTLWSVMNENFGSQRATFLGNISKSKSEASKKYPKALFSDLKGDSYVTVPSFHKHDDGTSDVFVFGKYEGSCIEKCEDLNYLKWYYLETRNVNAARTLVLGGYFLDFNNVFETREERDNYMMIDIAEKMLLNGKHEVEFGSNIRIGDDCNSIKVHTEKNRKHIDRFPYGQELIVSDDIEFSEREYKGFAYGVIDGCRTMKKDTFIIEVKDGVIQSIEIKD